MTAVASPPSVQQLPRWDLGKNGADGLETMTSEEVSRMFIPTKPAPRPVPAANSNSTPAPSQPAPRQSNPMQSEHTSTQANDDSTLTNGDDGAYNPRKKVAKFWPNTKAESVTGLSTGRGPPLNPPSSGQSAASAINSALQSQNAISSQPQTNGITADNSQQAVLGLYPLTVTFERKKILVPFFPEVQKIGRQTNQKTVPATNNGFFDSKVLSRSHAEIWAERNGKIWIRDVKSSNGTFVNGLRLSPENKESDPHELREGDTLELGIDIVSEDQKSIVHHKVSAKVETAGLYNSAANMLDMMHIDPSTGHSMLTDPSSQQHGQLRGRTAQGSMGPAGRGGANVANGAGMLGSHRPVNMWMGPITIEQVVKKLTTELKHAKQQSQELHRTQDFFTSLLHTEPGQEPPKAPSPLPAEHKKPNGVVPMPQDYHNLYEPPAPPPSQPLPDKPTDSGTSMADSLINPSLQRADTEKAPIPFGSSFQNGHQDSQILSLLDALKTAKHELSTQGDRMKHLEAALKRERKARVDAERRAQSVSKTQEPEFSLADEVNGATDLPLDSLELIDQDFDNDDAASLNSDHTHSLLSSVSSRETLREQPLTESAPSIDSQPMDDRYELLKQEFNQVKLAMENYKRKAEEAEASQRHFADLVESARSVRPRLDQGKASSSDLSNNHSSPIDTRSSASNNSNSKDGSTGLSSDRDSNWSISRSSGKDIPHLTNGFASGGPKLPQELERSLSKVLEAQQLLTKHRDDSKLMQSAPYMSMVGVVLIGVGLMTWLNGWNGPPPSGGKLTE